MATRLDERPGSSISGESGSLDSVNVQTTLVRSPISPGSSVAARSRFLTTAASSLSRAALVSSRISSSFSDSSRRGLMRSTSGSSVFTKIGRAHV